MPLANIKEKIETERQNYSSKMMLEDTKCKAITANKEYLEQMNNMQRFKDKLEKKIK